MKTEAKKINKAIAIFEGVQIRRHWDEEKELWYFAVVDVVAVLTNSNNPQVYWRGLKKRLIDEGANESVTKCNGLKMVAAYSKICASVAGQRNRAPYSCTNSVAQQFNVSG